MNNMYDNGVVIDAPAAGASMAMPLSYILFILQVYLRYSSPVLLKGEHAHSVKSMTRP